MNSLKPLAIFMALVATTVSARADTLVDALVEEFFTELSAYQGYNRLRAPDVDDYIGHAFYVDRSDVRCPGELVPLARAGASLQATKLVDFRDTKGLPKPAPTANWTAIKISSFITQGVEAKVSAKFPDRAAEVKAAASAFRTSNAQILVASRSVPAADYKQAAAKKLRAYGFTKPADIEVGATGVVVPVAELLVQKFEFDVEILKARNLSLGAQFLEAFGLKVAGSQSESLKGGYTLPTNSVLAFKPVSLLFDLSKCPN